MVTPYTSSFPAAAPNVTNRLLQDFCPNDDTEHVGISYDKAAIQLVLNGLDPAHAKDAHLLTRIRPSFLHLGRLSITG
ncbi:hypothetical protein [Amycolatopsis rhizosphaerae]|uniref:hypothetical protein n=1 Tax=Amycolatopsis rhizosphaerae TaxID=2053003 RepID=UPI001643DD58|nr:hypothetical protein [Amycolatopsis rhizosphaerae]